MAQVLCTIVLVWQFTVWPMDSTRQNLLYILNEYMYLTCAFFMLGFSRYNYQVERRFETGWFYVTFLGSILALNVIVMLIDIILGIKLACKRRMHNKRVE